MKLTLYSTLLIAVAAPLNAQGPGRVGLQQAAVTPVLHRVSLSTVSVHDSVAPNQWVKGALIGGSVGAVVAAAAIVILAGIPEGDAPSASKLVLGVGGSALVGALIGGMIGSFSHK